MSFAFTIDGLLWHVTWQGVTLQQDFNTEREARQYLRDLACISNTGLTR